MLKLDQKLQFIINEELTNALDDYRKDIVSLQEKRESLDPLDPDRSKFNKQIDLTVQTALEVIFERLNTVLTELVILPYKNQDELHRKLQANQINPELFDLIKLMKTVKLATKNSTEIKKKLYKLILG